MPLYFTVVWLRFSCLLRVVVAHAPAIVCGNTPLLFRLHCRFIICRPYRLLILSVRHVNATIVTIICRHCWLYIVYLSRHAAHGHYYWLSDISHIIYIRDAGVVIGYHHCCLLPRRLFHY